MIIKNPTWCGLNPDLPTFEPAHNAASQKILSLLQTEGKVYNAFFDGTATQSYWVVPSHQSTSWFVKLTPNHTAAAQNIELFLKQTDVHFAAPIVHLSQPFDDDTYLWVYPYLTGRRPTASVKDCARIGAKLAVLHQKLRQYPEIALIKSKTAERLEQLNLCRKWICAGEILPKVNPKTIQQLAQREELTFGDTESTPLHGDLNLGNILLDEDGSVHLIDYEDATHSCLPVVYELAFLIERLILVNEPDNHKALQLGQTLLTAYRQNGGEYHYQPNHCDSLEAINLRSLCTLVFCQSQNVDVVDREWQKFFFLLEMAERRKNVLEAILKT